MLTLHNCNVTDQMLTWQIEGGALVAALGGAAARVDALHVLQLVLATVRALCTQQPASGQLLCQIFEN